MQSLALFPSQNRKATQKFLFQTKEGGSPIEHFQMIHEDAEVLSYVLYLVVLGFTWKRIMAKKDVVGA